MKYFLRWCSFLAGSKMITSFEWAFLQYAFWICVQLPAYTFVFRSARSVIGQLGIASIDSMSLCLCSAQLLLQGIDLVLHRVHPLFQATHVGPESIFFGKHGIAVLTATVVAGQAVAMRG